ncbi:hypothetical protein ACXJJ3_32725 [Kribbella sp. WER1]
MITPFQKFQRGRRYRVLVEGVGENDYSLRVGGATVRFGPISDRTKVRVEELPPEAPKWRAGDVLSLQFVRGGSSYTYVRGLYGWPGERKSLTDAEIDRSWRLGLVTPLLQAGGQPFDMERIYGA